MGILLARILQTIIDVYVLVIFLSAVLSFFLPPYNKFREIIDGLVQPLLAPLRRVIPPIGMIDITPIVLILIFQVGGSLIVNILVKIP